MRGRRFFEGATAISLVLCFGASLSEAAKPQWQNGKITDIVPLVFAWTYEIEGESDVYVATKYQKPCRVTIDAPLRFAVDGDTLRLIDESRKEHRLRIDFKKPRPQESAGSDATPGMIPTGGAIKSGMSAAEVEQILGKPKETAEEGPRARWTYEDVIVIFNSGRVIELKFEK